MNEKIIDEIIKELRQDGIPPYCLNETLKSYINEGDLVLRRFVATIDYSKDHMARSFIKNYVYYAFNHVTHEFTTNYADDLLSWSYSMIGNQNV